MRKSNIITGILFFLFGLWVFCATFAFKQTLILDNYLGASFFPRIIAVVMMLLAALLCLQNGRAGGESSEEAAPFAPDRLLRPGLVTAALVAYVFLLKLAGFCLSSTLLFWAILFIARVRKKSFYGIAPVFVGIVYFIFRYLFLVQLPTGYIGF